MPIRVILEDDDGGVLHHAELAPGTTFLVPDYIEEEQNVLYVASPSDDLGGRIYREPGVMEDANGETVANPEDFAELPGDDKVIRDVPIAGNTVYEMTTKDAVKLRVRLKHVGQIVLLCHPNTQFALLDLQKSADETDQWVYNPFQIWLN